MLDRDTSFSNIILKTDSFLAYKLLLPNLFNSANYTILLLEKKYFLPLCLG